MSLAVANRSIGAQPTPARPDRPPASEAPLLLAVVAFMGGIYLDSRIDFTPAELWSLPLLLFILSLSAARASSPKLARCCLTLAITFSGALLHHLHRLPAPPSIEREPRELLIVEGCVVAPPEYLPDQLRFVLELGKNARARISFYPRPGSTPPSLHYGQRIQTVARLRPVRNFGNPGSFDLGTYLARQHIYWTGSVPSGVAIRVLPGKCGSRLKTALYRLRTLIENRIEQTYSGQPFEQAMVRALLLGAKSAIDPDWARPYRLTGTYHALVISGLHLGILASATVFFLRVLWIGLLPALWSSTLLAWLYAALIGWQTPVVRAAAGLTLLALCRFLYRRPRPLNLLAAAAFSLLLADPNQLFDTGFQLSFLSVAALICIASPLIQRTSAPYRQALRRLADDRLDILLAPRQAQFRVELRLLAETAALPLRLPVRWVLRSLSLVFWLVFRGYELLVASFSVQVALLLPMAVYFHRLVTIGVLANLLVVPLMSLLLPLAVVAVASQAALPASGASFLLRLLQNTVEFHATFQPDLRVPDLPPWLFIFGSLSLLVLAAGLVSNKRYVWVGVLSSFGLVAILVLYPIPPRIHKGQLELTALDVGQGDALLLVLPDGKLVAVDAGGLPGFFSTRSSFDPGEDVVSPYLWSRFIRRLDAIVVSHFHEDHCGGVPALIANFRPRELWVSRIPAQGLGPEVLRLARRHNVHIRYLSAGHCFDFGGATFSVLAPETAEDASLPPADRDSLVLHVSFAGRSLLLTGDLDPRIERDLTASERLRPAQVLKVAHHGSRRSTGDQFLAVVRPALAIVSAGFENSYGHPHPELLERLAETKATILRTDQWGCIQIRISHRNLELDTYRWQLESRTLLRRQF